MRRIVELYLRPDRTLPVCQSLLARLHCAEQNALSTPIRREAVKSRLTQLLLQFLGERNQPRRETAGPEADTREFV